MKIEHTRQRWPQNARKHAPIVSLALPVACPHVRSHALMAGGQTPRELCWCTMRTVTHPQEGQTSGTAGRECEGRSDNTGIRARRHRTHQLTKPGFWKNGGNRGNGENWRNVGGNGGKRGRNGEVTGMAHGMRVVEGCGGMWLRKMGQKWDEIPIYHSPISPIFPEVEGLSHSSLCKNQLNALTDEKMRLFVTHRHSPPRRVVRVLGQQAAVGQRAPAHGAKSRGIGQQRLPEPGNTCNVTPSHQRHTSRPTEGNALRLWFSFRTARTTPRTRNARPAPTRDGII